ncbi:hypothetical protein OG216_47940 (plasmid) [Streptomycetaceae bacterium NBC_01309]
MSINGYGYDRGGDVTPLFGGQPGAPVPRSRRDERRADEAMRAEQRRADQTQRDQQRLDAELARREADRLDERARREERRADADAELERKRARRTDAQREKARAKKEKAARSAARRAAFVAAVTEHMPLIGIPVVAVSLVVGWTGQAQAAAHLGMGAMALGIPVLTEGMVLTLAGLTAHAIGAKPQLPYRGLYRATWTAGLFAAASNAGGHLIEDASPQGVYRAAAYALASLAGLVLWAIVMRAKRAAADGASAAEVARWRRIRRSHPVVARRAQRIADLSGREFPEAFALAWERRTAAGTDEPTIREIRRQRGATWSRAQAEAWDGNPATRKVKNAVPAVPADTAETVPENADAGSRTLVAEAVPVLAPGSGLWVPTGPDGRFERSAAAVPGTDPEGPGGLFPPGIGASEAVVDAAADEAPEQVPSVFSDRVLKRAAVEWRKIHAAATADPTYRSSKGHLGVSPYALARRLSIRKADGPALVAELVDRQMIPVGE